jgi:FkbM family methyltransferase
MAEVKAYQPTITSGRKYKLYLAYLREYIRQGDWHSLLSAFRFLLGGKREAKDRIAKSRLGTFAVRKGTIDFQFINFYYESEIRKYLLSKLSEFDVFVDVGACIGEYSIWLARLGKHSFAFEPVPANYACIKQNIGLNKVEDKLTAYNFGLGAKEAKVPFSIDLRETGSSHFVEGEAQNLPTLEIKTLDNALNPSVISNHQRVIMKLDVEGMEEAVIRGASSFIERMASLEIIYEDKHSGIDEVKQLLQQYASFTFRKIDDHNTLAVKNKPS